MALPLYQGLWPRWLQITPFFLSAILFLSGVFAILAPLPLLLFFFQSKRHWAALSVLSNTVIVSLLSGNLGVALFAIFVATLVLVLPVVLLNSKSIELSVGLTLVAMAVVGTLILLTSAHLHHLNPLDEIHQRISYFVEFLIQSLSKETQSTFLGGLNHEEWKQNFITELPSAVAIFALILVWANLVALLRINPLQLCEKLGIEPTFLKKWKAPEIMIWPTILCGFFLVFHINWVSEIALNLFKFLMAIYALQGLSVLSFLFDAWNLRGLFRTLGFLAAVFLMMPLLLSIGFFDVWFDFRSKLRQS